MPALWANRMRARSMWLHGLLLALGCLVPPLVLSSLCVAVRVVVGAEALLEFQVLAPVG